MELSDDARVYSSDEKEIGKINRFVLNPVSKKLTHIVVQKGLLFPEDKVVPIDWVTTTESDRVVLSAHSDDIQNLPSFEEVHYVNLDESERQNYDSMPYRYAPMYYWYPSPVASGYMYPYAPSDVVTTTEQNIPDNTVALKEGADVITKDGDHIGDIDSVFANPDSNKTTHFVISQGLFLKERKLVPIDWIDSIKENKVHLAVGSKFVDSLPAYESKG